MALDPIVLVLTDGFSDWEIAPLAGLGRAFYGADIRVTSTEGGPLQSAGGLSLAPTERFTPQPSSVVVVCGGPKVESEADAALEDALRIAFAKGCAIAGICGGTAALARAGLLDAVAHTSNGVGYLEQHAPAYRGAAHYVDQPAAVRDGRVITAAAPAPASFASEVLQAAGLPKDAADEMRGMLGREHLAKFAGDDASQGARGTPSLEVPR